MIKVRIFESSKDAQVYVTFDGMNDEPWFTSQGYDSRGNAVRSLEAFYMAVNTPGILIEHFDKHGEKIEYKHEYTQIMGGETSDG